MLNFAHWWVIQTAQHLYTEEKARTGPFYQVFTESSKLAFRAGFIRGKWYWVSCVGDARNFHSISFQDKKVTPKIDALASTPISCPQSMSLQPPEQRECSQSYHGQSYPLSLTSVISTSTTRMPMLTSTHPLFPLIQQGGSRKHLGECIELPVYVT